VAALAGVAAALSLLVIGPAAAQDARTGVPPETGSSSTRSPS
jgi:hypothetical protein